MSDDLQPGEVGAAITYIFSLAFFMFLLAFLSGCGGKLKDLGPLCTAPEVDSSTAAIVNGTPSVTRRATVKVTAPGGYCSGTVIGPHTVLTAGHCELLDTVRLAPAYQATPTINFTIVDQLVHPDYFFPINDLRLLYTDEALPGPYAALGSQEGCTHLLAQGYGYGSSGELHERVVEHEYRSGDSIYGSESICFGDSGGPLWAIQPDGDYSLVGVTSFGLNQSDECEGGATGFVDLTTNNRIQWIEENIK